MEHKKVTYSLHNLKALVDSPNSCVYSIKNCNRILSVTPVHLDNIKNSVNELLNAKVTTYDPILKGIILGFKKIKVVNHVQLNDDGNFGLDYVADIFIFKPEVGNLLSGEVNKISKDHIAVLVHSFFNVCIPRPRHDNECPKTWNGFDINIGQSVTFEVVKVNMSARLPFIKGKLIDVKENDNEDKDSGIGGHESMEECNAKDGSEKLESGEEVSNDVVKKKKKKKKKKSDLLVVDYEEDLNVENFIDKSKEESKTEELVDALMRDATLELNNCSGGKKKKKKRNAGSLNTDSVEIELKVHSTLSDSTIETIKNKKKKKKRKHSESEIFSTCSNLATNEVMDTVLHKKKKKKHSNSDISHFPE